MVKFNELSERASKLIRIWLLVVQIPLIIVLGFNGKEWADFNKMMQQLPAGITLPALISFRGNTLLAVTVIQVLNIPFALTAVVRTTKVVTRIAAGAALPLLITALMLASSNQMKVGFYGTWLPMTTTPVMVRGWFGAIFVVSYFVPLVVLALKARTPSAASEKQPLPVTSDPHAVNISDFPPPPPAYPFGQAGADSCPTCGHSAAIAKV